MNLRFPNSFLLDGALSRVRPTGVILVLGLSLDARAFAAGGEAEVRVLGRVTLESRRLHEHGKIRLEGAVKDDLGRSLPSSSLHFDSPVALCGSSEVFTEIPARPDGGFCVLLSESQLDQTLTVRSPNHVEFKTIPSVLPEVQLEPRIEFSAPSYLWALESPDPSLEFGVRGTGFPELATFSVSAECSSKIHPLGTFSAAKDGPTFVRIQEQPELPAGHCRLFAKGSFNGVAEQSEASATLTIERPVTLRVLSNDSSLYEIAANAKDGSGASGMIEVRGHDGRYLAGANVISGRATLDLSHLTHEELTFHFLSGAPWYRAGPPLRVSHEPEPGWYADSRIHFSLLVLFLVFFARRLLKKSPTPATLDADSLGGVEVVEVPREKLIRGVVRDAHTREPVSAQVELFRKSASGGELIGACASGEDGSFSFSFPSGGLLEVVVTNERYLTLVAPVRRGKVEIRVVARRRALLSQVEALVRNRPELRASQLMPTPEQLRREASVDLRAADEQWAEAIDQLAYGPEEPGEGAVSALTPPAVPPSP